MNCPMTLPSGQTCNAPMTVRGTACGSGLVCRLRVCQGKDRHEVFTEERVGNKRLWNLLRAAAMQKARANFVTTSKHKVTTRY